MEARELLASLLIPFASLSSFRCFIEMGGQYPEAQTGRERYPAAIMLADATGIFWAVSEGPTLGITLTPPPFGTPRCYSQVLALSGHDTG